jgi:hypothetical protein
MKRAESPAAIYALPFEQASTIRRILSIAKVLAVILITAFNKQQTATLEQLCRRFVHETLARKLV